MQLPQCPVNGGSPVVGVAEKRRRWLLHPEKTAQIFLHGTVRQLRSNDQPGIRIQPHGAENSRVFFRVELMTDQSGDIRVDDPDSGMPAALKITQRLAPGIAGVLRNCRPAGDPVVFRLTVEQDDGNRQAFQGKKDFFISQKGAGFPQDAGNSAPPDHFHDLVVFHRVEVFIGTVLQFNIAIMERLFDSEHDLRDDMFRIRRGWSGIEQEHITPAFFISATGIDESSFSASSDDQVFFFEPFQRGAERVA